MNWMKVAEALLARAEELQNQATGWSYSPVKVAQLMRAGALSDIAKALLDGLAEQPVERELGEIPF